MERLANFSDKSVLYVDESHDHDAQVSSLSITTKKGDNQEFTKGLGWNKNNNYTNYNNFDFVFVNGNHFTARKQLVILDSRKEESVSRKLDRLTDVKAFISVDQQSAPFEFLSKHLSDVESIPILPISDTEGIWKFLAADYDPAPLKAFVLAGGKSQRMGQDKGAIDYHGKPQSRFLYEMLSEAGIETYISCREEQAEQYKGFPQIHDKFIGLGPFGAIASAFMQDPNAAWLIIPCDLPLLQAEHIKKLTEKRDPHKFATAFLNHETQFPEPLISIWEPKMYQQLLNFLAQGFSCPRKVLINSDVELVEVEDQQFMMNVNTPQEYKEASALIERR